MLKITLAAALILAGQSAIACTAADVEGRQTALLTAMQALIATDPAKAQMIVARIQQELDTAAANGDEAAACTIFDRALADATG